MIKHPGQPLPIPISPLRNKDIHSFYLTFDIEEYIHDKLPRPPRIREWRSHHEVEICALRNWNPNQQMVLKGELHGPLLQQGMIFYQGGRCFLIDYEYGPLHLQEVSILTNCISVTTKIPFSLLIPMQYVKKFEHPYEDSHSTMSIRSKYLDQYHRTDLNSTLNYV